MTYNFTTVFLFYNPSEYRRRQHHKRSLRGGGRRPRILSTKRKGCVFVLESITTGRNWTVGG